MLRCAVRVMCYSMALLHAAAAAKAGDPNTLVFVCVIGGVWLAVADLTR